MPPPFYCEVIGQNIGVASPGGTGTLQSLDAHIFRPQWTQTKSEAAEGVVSREARLRVMATAVGTLLAHRDWQRAFEGTGVTKQQNCISSHDWALQWDECPKIPAGRAPCIFPSPGAGIGNIEAWVKERAGDDSLFHTSEPWTDGSSSSALITWKDATAGNAEEARTYEAWFQLTFRPQKWNLKAHMWYQLSPFPSSNAAIAMQHHPGNIHQSVATPRYSATPWYVLIQLPNVIDTISKRWRSRKAFNTSPFHIFP